MSDTATVMLQKGPRDLRQASVAIPQPGPGAAILRVEACGICGSDIDAIDAVAIGRVDHFPRVLGHEIVGTVERVGEGGRADGVNVGDLVAVDPLLSCGTCRYCLSGGVNRAHCRGWPFTPAQYGLLPFAYEHGLWGGYASHVYAPPEAVLYPVPEGVSAIDATLWNPLAAGIQWGVLTPGTAPGSTLAILGPGQRGLATLVAAKAAGASTVIVTGTSADQHKLDLAKKLGATATVTVDVGDTVARVRHLTDGEGVDIVIDTSSHAVQPVNDSVAMARPGGTVVWAGLKNKPVDSFPVDQAIAKGLTIRTVLGQSSDASIRALSLLATSHGAALSAMRTHAFPIGSALQAIDVLAGRVIDERSINVILTP